MKNLINLLKTPLAMIALIILFLAISGVLFGLAQSMQSSTTGHESEHSDVPVGATVVTIHGEEILASEPLDQIRDKVLNNVYGEHYSKTGLVERHAKYTSDVNQQDKDSYSFKILFTPSKTEYSVDLSINNIKENDLSISVGQVK